MRTKGGPGKEVIEDQMIFMGVGGDQKIYGFFPLERKQLSQITRGVDDGPDSIGHQNGMAKGISASPNEFDCPFFKIEQALYHPQGE